MRRRWRSVRSRRSELQGLRWEDIDLIENRLRVVTRRPRLGSRSVAIAPALAEELWQHRRSSDYRADGDRVFCNPERGTVIGTRGFASALREAYKAAGMTFPEGMRPFHDLRVTSITNDAIAGANPIALMTKAGHASMADDPALLEARRNRVPRRGGRARSACSRRVALERERRAAPPSRFRSFYSGLLPD